MLNITAVEARHVTTIIRLRVEVPPCLLTARTATRLLKRRAIRRRIRGARVRRLGLSRRSIISRGSALGAEVLVRTGWAWAGCETGETVRRSSRRLSAPPLCIFVFPFLSRSLARSSFSPSSTYCRYYYYRQQVSALELSSNTSKNPARLRASKATHLPSLVVRDTSHLPRLRSLFFTCPYFSPPSLPYLTYVSRSFSSFSPPPPSSATHLLS